MHCVIVSHTHWDREWYRTFQAFRARLVDTVDRVLELVDEDDGYYFQLDGQTIVVEDYLAIRPERRADLERACRAGRVAIGPWYVQPDSLLPAGETHVRNLLEGRRVAETIAGSSPVAYTPDSFGHPAQFPQLFAGFGLDPFVYWRGNGSEIEGLPAEYRWVAPDGSSVRACHLGKGYFPAWGLGSNVDAAVARLRQLGDDLAKRTRNDCVLFMNGIDHMLPDANTREVAEALAAATGWTVQRGLLDDFVAGVPNELPAFEGELVGGHLANLLPGVWSTRTALKLDNRRCESLLVGWAEPWIALGRALGAPDERPSLQLAWRELLPNQAHDSICGCSQDRVHEQMAARTDNAHELAEVTLDRVLERIAGLDVERQVAPLPAREGAPGPEIPVAVFNPSPHLRSDVVRLPLDGHPAFAARGIHPLLLANANARELGFLVGGRPARIVQHCDHVRANLQPEQPVFDLEFVATDVPALGWQRLLLTRGEVAPEQVDEGREIAAGSISVAVDDDGTFRVELGDQSFAGLCGLEDTGDRGDSYDYDPVEPSLREACAVEVERTRHPNGIQTLRVSRRLRLPRGLDDDRASRSAECVELPVVAEARVAPGVARVDLRVVVDNTAQDHRLRLLFPTGGPCGEFEAATTFDIAKRAPGPADGRAWIHPAPATFPQQGFVAAGGLCVAAPGLVEAEVTAEGEIAITLLRSVGWLSRPDLRTRPGEAGPSLPTPGAQCPGRLVAELSLLAAADPVAAKADARAGGGGSSGEPTAGHARAAWDAELGLRAVGAGDAPLLEPGRAALEVDPAVVQLSTLKPAVDGRGAILRLLNPSGEEQVATVHCRLPLRSVRPARLDETPLAGDVAHESGTFTLKVAAHGLHTVRLEW